MTLFRVADWPRACPVVGVVRSSPAPTNALKERTLNPEKRIRHVGSEGATSIEYAFMASLIGVAIVATVLLLGQRLIPVFQSVIDGLTS